MHMVKLIFLERLSVEHKKNPKTNNRTPGSLATYVCMSVFCSTYCFVFEGLLFWILNLPKKILLEKTDERTMKFTKAVMFNFRSLLL